MFGFGKISNPSELKPSDILMFTLKYDRFFIDKSDYCTSLLFI